MIIKLAGKTIKVNHIHRYVEEYCKEYLVKDSPKVPGFIVDVCQEDISFEQRKSEAEDKKEGIPIRHFSDEYLETLAVYRKISDKMIENDTILFHGSVISVDGEGYLFTAKSGTGKSTHTKLWREYFGEGAVIVNDDKPLLKVTEDGVIAYGTPWDGKHRLSNNIYAPLKGICILERNDKNYIKEVDKHQSYPMILQQCHRSMNPKILSETLKLIDRLMNNVKIYCLGCNMELEAVEVAYNGMNSKSLKQNKID